MAEIVEFHPPDASGFVMTPTAEAIVSLLDYCQRYAELGLIVGDPGVGKTTAIAHYADNTAHVTAFEMIRLPTRAFGPALEALCAGVGYELYARDHVAERSRRLLLWLAERWDGLDEHRPLIIIDEAQCLPENVVDYLRHCWSAALIGIVLSGNGELRRRFNKSKSTNLAPFDSRLGPRLDLHAPSRADVATICCARGVQGAREAAYLQRHAEAGGLRRIDKIIATAARRFPGEAIRLPQIETAILFLGLS